MTVVQRAWAAMLHQRTVLSELAGDVGPMDPAIALDMVQDEVGDREEAKRDLYWYTWRLAANAPESIEDVLLASVGTKLVFNMRHGNLIDAREQLEYIFRIVAFPVPPLMQYHEWQLWAMSVDVVLTICEKLRDL